MNRGAWQATVHEFAKSWTRLSDRSFCNEQLILLTILRIVKLISSIVILQEKLPKNYKLV